MAPKLKATTPQSTAPETPKEYPTIAAQLKAEYLASRPYQVLKDTKGLSGMTADEKAAYATYRFLDTGAWRTFTEPQQKEFWRLVVDQRIPQPLPKPQDLGKDARGREIGSYTPEEYRAYRKREEQLKGFMKESERFRSKSRKQGSAEEGQGVIEEGNRRKVIAGLRGKVMGRYEGNPVWDDVVPIPQEEGEGALAQIAYTDEYVEAMGYLRAVMAAKEHSPRVLDLTEHVISLNAAHYTVWLYRASTILALNIPIDKELEWMNEVALENQKNYQIWTHRQTLIDHIFPTLSSDPAAAQAFADAESAFMAEMFEEDAKNYHVWGHRQYVVRKFNLFDSDAELKSIEALLHEDVRNNSAWSHRFFLAFSNPAYTTAGSKATEHDPKIPDAIIDRELAFAQAAAHEAPQNQSAWEYIRGVLRKGGRELATLEEFAGEFVRIPEGGEEDIKSSHALDFLADVWSEKGEVDKADRALRLLGEKYDRIRKNYWDWKRGLLKGAKV